jgi:hypothetical protein
MSGIKPNGIRLHGKHGVNPTMGMCFFCGGETGEIGLLGYNKNKEAPKHAVLNYVPCDVCAYTFSKGTLLIEVTEASPDGRPEIQKGLYPTGYYMLMKSSAAQGIFGITEDQPTVLVEKGILEDLINKVEKANEAVK